MGTNSYSITEIAPAKLNIRLRIIGRRADGYHLLSMLAVTISLHDQLDAASWQGWGGLKLSGAYAAESGPVQQNLVYRAFNLFMRHCPDFSGAQISLKKMIPVGAGLGGGSSDAAAALRAFKRLYEHQTGSSLVEWPSIVGAALSLGADVPFLLQGGNCKISGIGEVLEPLPIGELLHTPVLVCVPQQPIATKGFYAFIRQTNPTLEQKADHELNLLSSDEPLSITRLAQLCANDFENYLPRYCPEVWAQLQALREISSLCCGLTGSGSAFFAFPRVGQFTTEDISAVHCIADRMGFQVHEARFVDVSNSRLD
ncbi:MAG: 4-(cytidine 5'-diphospho)-2-C-methyl-D-erythritol kinase [Oligoflexia bacterium]|nr:4-(cytidine 5'-diphospho)-2-C-methyl-D-erythritol kinase [Oligoflexia bacterium]